MRVHVCGSLALNATYPDNVNVEYIFIPPKNETLGHSTYVLLQVKDFFQTKNSLVHCHTNFFYVFHWKARAGRDSMEADCSIEASIGPLHFFGVSVGDW